MKKLLMLSMVVILLATGAVNAIAGKKGTGAPISRDICSGEPETITGVVANVCTSSCLIISTDGATETVYGLGPVWYWDVNKIDKPEIGETVTVTASSVTVSDKKVILSISLDGQTLQLRDFSTCLPLWR